MIPDESDAMMRGYFHGMLAARRLLSIAQEQQRLVDSLPKWWNWRDPIGNAYRYAAERTTPQWVRELLDGLNTKKEGD